LFAPGSRIEIRIAGGKVFEVSRDQSRERALARLRKLRRRLPLDSSLTAQTRMPAKPFLDSSVLIYAVAQEEARGTRAEELLAMGSILSVQVLNEFTSVARRKIRMPWAEVREALAAIRILCATPTPITAQTHETALRIGEQYSYGIYDALIAAAALEAGCVTLYSEDFQDGQNIDGQLTIRNPFK